jgi:hypothetical protein
MSRTVAHAGDGGVGTETRQPEGRNLGHKGLGGLSSEVLASRPLARPSFARGENRVVMVKSRRIRSWS